MVNPIGTDRAQRCSVVAVDHVLGQRARREERCFLPGSVSSRDQLPPLWRDPGAVERRLLGRLDFYRRRTEDHDAMVEMRLPDAREVVGGKRPGEVDAGDLGAQRRRQLADVDGHSRHYSSAKTER